jgi:KDO2-lipid IV(A) lauroyltransferase
MIDYVFRFAGFICPLLPSRLGYWLFARAGDLVFLFSDRNGYYWRNLRRVLGDSAPPARVNAVARRAHQNLLKNYFDLFSSHKLTRQELDRHLVAIHGLELIENALAGGKGLIIGSGHFGAWDIVIHIAAMFLKAHVILPVEQIKPEKLFHTISEWRAAQGIEIVPLDIAPRAIIKTLRAGQIVGLAYDRDITKSGPYVDFFGKPAQMPEGAAQLAIKYGAPVIVGISVRHPDNRCEVFVEPPIEFERTGDTQRDVRAGVQKIARVLEKFIRQYPDQWLMFQKIWEDENS